MVEVLLGINRCGSFPLLSSPNSLFTIWTDLKRSEKIPGAPTWRWGEWIWLTGPSELHQNLPRVLNISSIRVFDQIPVHSPTFPSLHLRHSSLSNPSVALLRHSSFSNPSVALLRHSSFSNPSVASPTPQFIIQHFFRFSYVRSSSLNSSGELPMWAIFPDICLTVEEKSQWRKWSDRETNPGLLDERKRRYLSTPAVIYGSRRRSWYFIRGKTIIRLRNIRNRNQWNLCIIF